MRRGSKLSYESRFPLEWGGRGSFFFRTWVQRRVAVQREAKIRRPACCWSSPAGQRTLALFAGGARTCAAGYVRAPLRNRSYVQSAIGRPDDEREKDANSATVSVPAFTNIPRGSPLFPAAHAILRTSFRENPTTISTATVPLTTPTTTRTRTANG